METIGPEKPELCTFGPLVKKVQCFMPVISAIWEAEAGGSQGQEFEINLANIGKP